MRFTKQLEIIKQMLANNPLAGTLEPNTEGARKIRWASEHSGKRGGIRLIYTYISNNSIIWLIAIYVKNEQEQIEKSKLRAIIKEIKEIESLR